MPAFFFINRYMLPNAFALDGVRFEDKFVLSKNCCIYDSDCSTISFGVRLSNAVVNILTYPPTTKEPELPQ